MIFHLRPRPTIINAASSTTTCASLLLLLRRTMAFTPPPSLPPAVELVLPSTALPPPLLFDSPHSGRTYDAILPTWQPVASLLDLRRGEDAYMDVVLRSACTAAGVPLLLQNYPRCYLDVNRAVDDLDPSLLQEPWPLAPPRPSDKTKKGLGLIRRFVRPGVAIYEEGRRLAYQDVVHRLQTVYWPYHGALNLALDSLTKQHNTVVHINWHSMKSRGNAMTPDGDSPRPDFVVSDVDGRSAGAHVTSAVVSTLKKQGYSVGLNVPYKGGYLIRTHGRPAAAIPRPGGGGGGGAKQQHEEEGERGGVVHSLQIEVNRGLYLEEEGVVVRQEGMHRMQHTVAELTRVLLGLQHQSSGQGTSRPSKPPSPPPAAQ